MPVNVFFLIATSKLYECPSDLITKYFERYQIVNL